MYTFTCTCGQSFPISPARAGQSVECPHCGESIGLPKLGEIKRLPLAQTSSQSDPVRTKWSMGQGIAFSLLGAAFCALSAVSGWSVYNWQRIPAPPTVEQFIESGKAELAQQDASGLLEFWINFGRPGIGTRHKPVYMQIHEYRSSWKHWALGFGAAAFVMAVGMGVIVRRRPQSDSNATR